MTWKNYGPKGWHIDHIIPLSTVNIEDREQYLKVTHYTNLQPLWAEENFSKGNRISEKDLLKYQQNVEKAKEFKK